MSVTLENENTEAQNVRDVVRRARIASRLLGVAPAAARNDTLIRLATILEHNSQSILTANARDIAQATASDAGEPIAPATLQRLRLDADKLASMVTQIRAIVALPDPLGRVLTRTQLDDGLELCKVTVPIGVIATIFEARPDAVTQVASLAVKSGNAVVLKCGQEATYTARALVHCLHEAISVHPDLSTDAIGIIEGRASVRTLLTLDDEIDLVIPRGSTALVNWVQTHTKIPVLGHAAGVCHVYVDRSANVKMGIDVVADGKIQSPSACNATEAVLVHRDVAGAFLPPLVTALRLGGVQVRGCERTRAFAASSEVLPATDEDWGREYGALTIACRVVDDIEAAIAHITTYGSKHTESIVTNDPAAADRFQREVDAAGVYHNASTRFADGFRYGLGAEVGVSTAKIHARGPVGLEGLTTYKYLLNGSGHIVRHYAGTDARRFLHQGE